jgi:hypothetical protein
MVNRLFRCALAVSVVCFLCGSITLSSINVESMTVGAVAVPGRWKASAPTVQSAEGEYLAYEVAGKSPRVYFTTEKGPHTSWAFLDQKPWGEHHLVHEQGTPGWISVDESGYTLRLRATEGPFRGWYLATAKGGKLVLTREASRAAVVKLLLKKTRSVSK